MRTHCSTHARGITPAYPTTRYYLLSYVMVKIAKQRLQLEPDPKWQPIADAIFLHAGETSSSVENFRFNFRWSDAPAAIAVHHGSRIFELTFNDSRVLRLPPWEFFKDENLPPGFAGAFVYRSVSEVWDLMVQRFARSVSEGHFKLFGRPQTFRAAFEPIPRDHWDLYHITDWFSGSALGPDGRQIWNIHASRPSVGKSKAGRKPIYDQDPINALVRRLYRDLGPFGPDKEKGWRTATDLQEKIAQFLVNTVGQCPAKSVLQKQAARAIEAIEADQK
jgi:hypothetical protein